MTTLTGKDIGRAHHATRAVLERRLAGAGIDFVTSVVLNLLSNNTSEMPPAAVVAALGNGLKIDDDEAREVLDRTLTAGLVERAGPGVRLTAAGFAVHRQVAVAVADIVERLYGGIPAADLAVAQRVLATVTARADADLGR